METDIRQYIEDPLQLEKLYRDDKKRFEKSFFEVYPEIEHLEVARFWNARLTYPTRGESKQYVRKTDVFFLILSCLLTVLLIKIPQLFDFKANDYLYYEKNAGLAIFIGLSAFIFLMSKQINFSKLIVSVVVFILAAVYINLLPLKRESDSIVLAFIHLPLFLWCLYGLIYIDYDMKNKTRRIDYVKYNGDIAILMAVILIAGGALTAMTLKLFSAIGLQIENFYFEYIVVPGLVSSPIVATFIVKKFPLITNKIAPIVANIFSPLVLITLVLYLAGIVFTGKDPYNDRDFLLVFNAMLLGVMAIIIFAVSGITVNKKYSFSALMLFALSVIALLIDIIALSAIVYRLGEFGFTPNRTAVLGSNLLIFGNLVLIAIDLYKVAFRGTGVERVEHTVAGYLPVYMVWTLLVACGFPFLFGMK